jgi:hypothetical protein
MTLRLPLNLREAITEESRVKGDLAWIVMFALGFGQLQLIIEAGMLLTGATSGFARFL